MKLEIINANTSTITFSAVEAGRLMRLAREIESEMGPQDGDGYAEVNFLLAPKQIELIKELGALDR